jgi:hypothetical protein
MMLRGIALDPLSRIMHVLLGDVYDLNGRPDEALASYRRAMEIDPNFQPALEYMANFYIAHGEIAEAIVLSRRELAESPSENWMYGNFAYQYGQLGAQDEVDYWMARAKDAGVALSQDFMAMYEHLGQNRGDEAARTATKILNFYPICRECWVVISNAMVDNGDASAILELIDEQFPVLKISSGPKIPRHYSFLAPPVIWAFLQTGRTSEAESLAADIFEFASNFPRQATRGFSIDISDVKIYALLGRNREALDSLRKAVNAGWRAGHDIEFGDRLLDPIRSDPEFIAIREEIRADMAKQYAWLQEMERNGKLAPIPD